MRAALVFRIAGLEMAGVVAGEDQDGITIQARFGQRVSNAADRVIHLRHAGKIIAQLAGPRSWEWPQVFRNERIWVAARVLLGRIERVAVVLVVDFQIRDRQQERGLCGPQETLRALG